MANEALAPLLEGRGNESDKQFLVNLSKRGRIARQELRVMARELDEGTDLEDVLIAYDEGELDIPKGKPGSRDFVTLDSVPEGATAKQMVAWLLRKDAITRGQARKAAQIIDETRVRPESDEEFVRTALRRVGAHSVLDEEPPEEPETVEGGEDDEDEETGSGGPPPPAGEGGGGNGEKPPPLPAGGQDANAEPQWPDPEAPLTAAGLYELTLPDAEAYIELVEDEAALDQIHAWERAHPNYGDGRIGVLNKVEERRGELAIDDSHDD